MVYLHRFAVGFRAVLLTQKHLKKKGTPVLVDIVGLNESGFLI